MALSISYWANFTEGQTKLQRRSENAVRSDHVLKFVYDRELNHVSATVQASMRNTSYKVDMLLNSSFGITSSSCECVLQNSDFCHHRAAALLFGFKCVAKTDVKCSWLNNPKSAAGRKEVKTMEEVFPSQRADYRALQRPVDNNDLDFVSDKLAALGRFSALHWILSPEPPKAVMPVPLVEDLLISEEYQTAETPATWLRRSLVVNQDTIIKVAELTTGQRDNSMWSMIRKMRVTASNFGAVLSARYGRISKSLKERLLSTYNLEKVRAISWGINHESQALANYVALGAQVHMTGLWLHESGCLGASPDGIVTKGPGPEGDKFLSCQSCSGDAKPDLLEIKCPYSAREMTITEASMKLKDFYLVPGNGGFSLNQKHHYYDQVQGQLYLLNKDFCDFLVWTEKDMRIVRIAKDPLWLPKLNVLINFYFNEFIPAITDD